MASRGGCELQQRGRIERVPGASARRPTAAVPVVPGLRVCSTLESSFSALCCLRLLSALADPPDRVRSFCRRRRRRRRRQPATTRPTAKTARVCRPFFLSLLSLISHPFVARIVVVRAGCARPRVAATELVALGCRSFSQNSAVPACTVVVLGGSRAISARLRFLRFGEKTERRSP